MTDGQTGRQTDRQVELCGPSQQVEVRNYVHTNYAFPPIQTSPASSWKRPGQRGYKIAYTDLGSKLDYVVTFALVQ